MNKTCLCEQRIMCLLLIIIRPSNRICISDNVTSLWIYRVVGHWDQPINNVIKNSCDISTLVSVLAKY